MADVKWDAKQVIKAACIEQNGIHCFDVKDVGAASASVGDHNLDAEQCWERAWDPVDEKLRIVFTS